MTDPKPSPRDLAAQAAERQRRAYFAQLAAWNESGALVGDDQIAAAVLAALFTEQERPHLLADRLRFGPAPARFVAQLVLELLTIVDEAGTTDAGVLAKIAEQRALLYARVDADLDADEGRAG